MDWQIIFVTASFVAMLGGVFKIARDFRNDLDENVKLLFKRFDAYKEQMDKKFLWQEEINDNKYMRLDNCGYIQNAFADKFDLLREDMKEMERKLDILLEERRVGSN